MLTLKDAVDAALEQAGIIEGEAPAAPPVDEEFSPKTAGESPDEIELLAGELESLSEGAHLRDGEPGVIRKIAEYLIIEEELEKAGIDKHAFFGRFLQGFKTAPKWMKGAVIGSSALLPASYMAGNIQGSARTARGMQRELMRRREAAGMY